jgi:hypothetical protein
VSATGTTISLDQVERDPSMSGAPVLMPLRRLLDVRAFGISCSTAPVGEPVIECHSEPDGDEELYVVVRDRAPFTVAGETFDIDPAALVQPETVREAVAMDRKRLCLRSGEARRPGACAVAARDRSGGVDEPCSQRWPRRLGNRALGTDWAARRRRSPRRP